MISFFPKPYKDEIYFSIIARYDRVTLNYSKDTLKELLGSNNKPLDIEYPLGVSYLVDQVRIFSKAYTVDYFLDNHTNYAFYKYFHKDILDSDISNTSFYKNIKYHRVKQIKKLKIKVCEKCLENNFVKYGDICVNRKHQLPGYFICRIHQIGLSNLKGTSVYNSSPKKFLPEYKDLEFEEINVPQKIFKELNSLENDTEYILENGKNLNINEFKNRCIEFLESKNLSLPQLKRADNIKKLLKQSFSQELFEYLGIDINEININKILNNTSHHIYVSELDYLKTILLMRALAGSVKNFFELKVEYKPFGELWMCMNPFCEYYKVRNIKKLK